MRRAVGVLLVVAVAFATGAGVLAISVTHAFRGTHEDLRAAGRLPPATLGGVLVALHPDPFGTSSPAQCAVAQTLRGLKNEIRYGSRTKFCGALDCWGPVPMWAAAEVLDRVEAPTTPLPLTLSAEVAYRLVPRKVQVDLYAEQYLRRFDLRSLAREHLGTELEQVSTYELLSLMARAETAGLCESLANPDIVWLRPQPSCDYYVGRRLGELESRMAEAGHVLQR